MRFPIPDIPDLSKTVGEFHDEMSAIRIELVTVREVLEKLLELELRKL